MIYLKKFDTHQEYEEARQNLDLPNVSLCEDDRSLHYNPYEEPPFIPSNIITYEASAKLDETTSSKNKGLHTNAFNTTIKSHTFENGVGTIEFNDDVTNIGSYAFFGSGLVKIEIPNSVTSIGYWAFHTCSGLTSIEIPNSVIGIGSSAFQFCTGLTSIEIPNSVTSIGGGAFDSCYGLTSIEIPNSVISIGNNVFRGCSGLTSVTVDNRNTVYDSRGNCNAIIETITNRLLQGCVNTVIPNTVTSIDSSAFDNCCALTSIEIPNSVISIGINAFYGCRVLTSVTIGSGVTSIGEGAFTTNSGRLDLTSFTIEATTPPTLNDTERTFSAKFIYVPLESVDAYKAASVWEDYADRILPIQ